MTRLTDADMENLDSLKSHFEHCLDNIHELLNNTNHADETYVEYLLRDNTTLNGYQNDSVAGSFGRLKELHDRILCNGGKQ
jgi:hypothetical protein